MDRYTETTYTSYGQNIGNSIKGIFFGFIFLIGSIVLLWWNEGRSVEQATALNEMQRSIETLPDTKYDALYEGKPVLVQGNVNPLNPIMDATFGVKSDGLILRRNVEMYQWDENEHSESRDKLGGGTETITTYEYVKKWSSSEISSTFFKHQAGHHNPPMRYKGDTYVTDAQLGDFHLDKSVVSYVGASQGYQGLASMPEQIGEAKNYKSYLYIGHNPASPQIGDIKISYTYAPAGVYTFAAKAQTGALTHYTTENGKRFIFARSGRVDAQTIFKQEHDANNMLTRILRVVGLMVMFFGFKMIMGLLATLAKVIPAFGSLVGGFTGLIAGALTFILGSLVIALAWFSSRPILSLIIIGVGVGIAFMLGKFGKKKESSVSAERDSSEGVTPPPRGNTTPPVRESTILNEQQDTVAPPPRDNPTPPPREV